MTFSVDSVENTKCCASLWFFYVADNDRTAKDSLGYVEMAVGRLVAASPHLSIVLSGLLNLFVVKEQLR